MVKREAFVVLGWLVIFTAAGCSPEYNAERIYWYAERAARPVLQDPAKASPQQVEQAVDGFEGVIKDAGGTPSAARAQFAIGSLRLQRHEYPQASEAYKRAIRNYGQYRQFVYASRIALIKVYEAQQDRSAVFGVYREIIHEHPWTSVGIQAPLLLAESAKQLGENQESEALLREAAAHYEGLRGHTPTRETDLRVRGQLVLVYERLGQWDRAISMLEGLSREKEGVNQAVVLLAMATLYDAQLHKRDQAAALYQKLIKDYANQPAGQQAALRLDHLKQNRTEPDFALLTAGGSEKLLSLPKADDLSKGLP